MRRLLVGAIAALPACAGGAPEPVPPAPVISAEETADTRVVRDTAGLIPAGHGSLRQEDIALKLQLPGTLVRAIPLDDSVIRVLSPDSWRALHDLVVSRETQIAAIARRAGTRETSVWYLSFYGIEPDARFSPMDVTITSAGRIFRPVDIIPLSAGFGEQRLRQRETQSALYVFGEGLHVEQPLSLRVEGSETLAWADILRRIERERALVRSRAARALDTP